MATATRWHVDDNTRVDFDPLSRNIEISQGSSGLITMAHTGTSCAELIDALLAACIESGRELPDLSRHGYMRWDGPMSETPPKVT